MRLGDWRKYAVSVDTAFLNLVLSHAGRSVYPHTTAVEMRLHNELTKLNSQVASLLKQLIL